MKLNISDGTKNLIYCLLGIVMILAAFFFGYKNFSQKNEVLKQERTVLKDEIQKLDEIQRNQKDYEARIAENKTQIKKYYKEFPILIKARDQILYAADLESRYDSMNIHKMDLGEAEYLIGTEGDAMALYRVPTNLECKVEYDQLKDFLIKTTEDGTRKAVDEIVLEVDTETGLLVGKINMSLYYMTGIDQKYKPTEIKDISIGTDNIFKQNTAGKKVQQEQAKESQNQESQNQQAPSQEGQQTQQ